MKNTDPFAKWNSFERNDPFKPWNDPMHRNDPFAPWNQPFGSVHDYEKYCDEHHIRDTNR